MSDPGHEMEHLTELETWSGCSSNGWKQNENFPMSSECHTVRSCASETFAPHKNEEPNSRLDIDMESAPLCHPLTQSALKSWNATSKARVCAVLLSGRRVGIAIKNVSERNLFSLPAHWTAGTVLDADVLWAVEASEEHRLKTQQCFEILYDFKPTRVVWSNSQTAERYNLLSDGPEPVTLIQ